MNDIEFINFFKYLKEINIPILKVLINGYIEFEFNDNEEYNKKNIIEIISKVINLYFGKNIFYFIYKKLSKYFRNKELINDIKTLNKFDKLFDIWKLLYNSLNGFISQNSHNSNFLFFPCLKDEKKNFTINIDDKNEMKNFIIKINFVCSPILCLNKNIDKFSLIKICNDKDEIFEIKYKDLSFNYNNEEIPFSKIFKIKFEFSINYYDIYINKAIKISKKDLNFNISFIKKIEILNNFLGEISSIIIKKEYGIIADYAESSPKIELLKMKIFKEKTNNEVQIKTNSYLISVKEEVNNIEFTKLFSYQYCGALFDIEIKYQNYSNRGKINLTEIEYLGGLNCFIPIFKIFKNIIYKLQYFDNNINNSNEIEKNNILSNIDKYFDKIKDILKIMLKIICLSEKNYLNFKKIIIPLIGSLAEISHSLNILSSSEIISHEHISFLFGDEVFSTLYILILISSFPINVKKMYRKIVGINDNLDNLKLSNDSIIFDIEKSKIKNINWYFIILIMYIEFILIYYNSSEKVSTNLKNQIKSFLIKYEKDKENIINKQEEAILILINNIQYFFGEEKLLNSENNIIEDKNFINDNNYYFHFIIYILSTYLNIKPILKLNDIENNNDSFYCKFLKFFENYFNKLEKINIIEEYVQMIINFIFYPEDNILLQKFFPFLYKENFINTNEIIMEELIDYHGQYHHLMKELFVFNRLWSNQKIFFNNTLEEIKHSKLKYKNINYYTRNFQRPIIYPVLDYKNRYPDFSNYKIDKNFYYKKEEKDDYNFELDCPELDEYTQEYDKEIFAKIEKNGKINVCEVCLVKQAYHVKGNLFIFYDDNKIRIYFYSYPFNLQNNEGEILCCNKGNEGETTPSDKIKNNLCYGSIFKCPKKDSNKKIKIYFEDIRLILSRIYFYRNSALEIFTETKSYYFNFVSEEKRESLFITFMYPCGNSYFPININGNLIGYMKLNKKIIEKNKYDNLIDKENNFIEFFSNQTSRGELCEMCIFDIIILLNLIANRSFNDLYQYPIFPLLYFFDVNKRLSVIRDMKEHIGFQESTENSKVRKAQFLKSYEETINEINESETNKDNLIMNELHCFNTHYSNNIYTSNYLIRLFPYSFIAIELQGNGFDNPNRLFYSIDETFNNISKQKSDLRELIPEFFYLPEMLVNINSINFNKRANGELVDDVIMPKNISNKRYSNINSNINEYGEIIVEDFSVQFTDYIPKNKIENIKKSFIFLEFMKNKLENLKDWTNWINIIFGLNQKFSQKNQQYFRTESYINFKDKKYTDYLKDDCIMNSVEFGMIPLQIIYDNKILNNLQKRKYEYDQYNYNNNSLSHKFKKQKSKIKDLINSIKKSYNNEINNKEIDYDINNKGVIIYNSINSESNDYWDEQLKIYIKLYNDYNIGKLEIYKNNILISEIIDHNDIIIDFFYNRRLNMFATTSYDGFICVYILPGKLFCVIKNHNNLFFDKIFLSSNPFPTIIAFVKKTNTFWVYSLSGILIRKAKTQIKPEEGIEIEIEPIFNTNGGTFKDKLKVIFKSENKIVNEYYNLPFLDLDYKENLNV